MSGLRDREDPGRYASGQRVNPNIWNDDYESVAAKAEAEVLKSDPVFKAALQKVYDEC